jgi:hypothetical protein
MRSRNLDPAVAQQQRVLTILWAALLASVGLYLGLAYVVTGGMDSATDEPAVLVIAMSIAAVTTAIASLILPRKLLSDDMLRQHLRSANPASSKAESSGREHRSARARGLYMVPWLFGVMLAEAVALFGFVLAFMTGEPALMIPFAIVAAALIAYERPDVPAFIDRAGKLSS